MECAQLREMKRKRMRSWKNLILVKCLVAPSGKSLYAPVDNSLRFTKTKALGNGFVNCSDKGVITPILISISLLRASRCS